MSSEQRGRVDPFAFPTDTTFRFVLLIAAVLGASLYLYSAIYLSIGNRADDLAAYQQCLAAAGDVRVLDPAVLTARADFLQTCTEPIHRPKVAFMLAGILVLASAAVAAYWLIPTWKLRRGGLEPLTADDAPEVVAELDRLARVAGLAHPPAWVWNPLAAAPTGLAFGRVGRRYVALTGGLVTRFTTNPDHFRAIVLHELAHLRNRDVDRTYLTVTAWWAFIGLGVVPFVLTLPGEPRDYVLGLTWRVLSLTALVYLIRNSVLRSREHYADVRAAEWGAREPLAGLLSSLPAARRGLVGRLRRVHPDPAERVARIEDPAPLLSIGFAEALGTGATATLAYAEVASLFAYFSNEGLQVRWLAALVFGPVTAAVIGLAIWRATYAALAAGRTPPNGALLGLGLGLGLALGQNLAFAAAVPRRIADTTMRLIGFEPDWFLLLVTSQVLFCAWLAGAAAVWISRGTAPPARWVAAVGVVLGAGLLAVWLGLFFLSHDLAALWPIVSAVQSGTYAELDAVTWVGPEAAWQAVQHPFAALVLEETFVLPLLIALWAFPLAAALLGRRNRSGLPLAPGSALLIGIAGAAAYAVVLVVLRAGLDLAIPESTADRDAFGLTFYYWMVALALLAQMAVAAVAAFRAPSLRVVHGLFAAFVTGSGAAWTLLGVNGLSGCVGFITVSSATDCGWVPSWFAWQVYRQVVGEGAAVALAAGLVVSLGFTLLRWSRSRPPALRPASVPR
jgi:Zn-dependent protease with chaperone function